MTTRPAQAPAEPPLLEDEAGPISWVGPRRRRYQASMLRGDFFVLRHLKTFLERVLPLHVRAGVSVVDIGCGEQPLRPLVEHLGANYTGVDIDQNSRTTVDVIADIGCVPLPDDSFDVVLCTEVLEHSSDISAAFAELRRLCRPGGVIILTTPFIYPLHEEPYDFVRLTPYMIRRCAAANDLEIGELTAAGDELEVVATVWCNLWSRGGAGKGKLRSAWNLLMRLPVNVLVLGLSPLLHRMLPRKYFLTTCCILLKPA